ncbi:hypothetical protein [Pseudomonas viridiflava]|uniref:Uncharacterized protein n=1 Tax=Pseudomonas viridiflava TaxID=33069 RepID=A0ABU7N833_PSEVI|nr:hypothetical protein [Pseudomonas viridiflava]MCJ8178322.1 hypothetical protein [Pseudomonas viridiflava]MDY0916655.1 hypothetical protein [Pseudomonas viridiflava]MEE3913111.1 hypothetical protein [Pseudomonas viridiflava]MEE3971953.1 hypothetical protein [Pseudomonas viridiflava]MEE4016803.1 hypothetical protein [Pseudomonas viridiflava]
MFIRLSKMLMGKHALAGKAEQTGEAKTLRYGSWRQAVTLADKVVCSTHDLVGSCLHRLLEGKSAKPATAARPPLLPEGDCHKIRYWSDVTTLG